MLVTGHEDIDRALRDPVSYKNCESVWSDIIDFSINSCFKTPALLDFLFTVKVL